MLDSTSATLRERLNWFVCWLCEVCQNYSMLCVMLWFLIRKGVSEQVIMCERINDWQLNWPCGTITRTDKLDFNPAAKNVL